MAQNKLGKDHKEFILNQLSCHVRPWQIKTELNDRFGIDVTLEAIYYYDKRYSKQIIAKRREFEEDFTKIPVANKINRLQQLQNIIEIALKWNVKNVSKDGIELLEKQLTSAIAAIKMAQIEVEGSKIDVTSKGEKIGIILKDLTSEDIDNFADTNADD